MKADSSHKLHSVYITCLTEFKQQKEANAAARKKKPAVRRKRAERAVETEIESSVHMKNSKKRLIEIETDADMSITTSELLDHISSRPRKKNKCN